MKKLLMRLLPALCLSIALIVSAFIFENGCKQIARGLFAVSFSTQGATESIGKNIQDFPSRISCSCGRVYGGGCEWVYGCGWFA